MLNQLVCVGRIVEINEETIKIAVTRNYKNENREYETDFISCKIFKNIAKNVNEFCEKGDLVGIKGRLETFDSKLIVIAEKVTFLSSKTESDEKEE